ncbi:MAG: hypothetical protein WCO51_12320 [bacterium]
MRNFLACVVLLLLVGCANVQKLQAGCEATTSTFAAMAECLKAQVADSSNPRLKNSPEVKLYLLKADQLTQQVSDKKISELDARVELQQLFVQLYQNEKSNSAASSAAATAAYNATRTKTTNCVPVGNSVSCTTY